MVFGLGLSLWVISIIFRFLSAHITISIENVKSKPITLPKTRQVRPVAYCRTQFIALAAQVQKFLKETNEDGIEYYCSENGETGSFEELLAKAPQVGGDRRKEFWWEGVVEEMEGEQWVVLDGEVL